MRQTKHCFEGNFAYRFGLSQPFQLQSLTAWRLRIMPEWFQQILTRLTLFTLKHFTCNKIQLKLLRECIIFLFIQIENKLYSEVHGRQARKTYRTDTEIIERGELKKILKSFGEIASQTTLIQYTWMPGIFRFMYFSRKLIVI